MEKENNKNKKENESLNKRNKKLEKDMNKQKVKNAHLLSDVKDKNIVGEKNKNCGKLLIN